MKAYLLLVLSVVLTACSESGESPGLFKQADANTIPAMGYIQYDETYNPEAVIPPQCYTKTEGKHNPCYVCHQSYKDRERPNKMNDGVLQGSYDFSDVGLSNSWKNLFKDRQGQIDKISDDFILKYIKQENYTQLINWMKSDEWNGAIPEIKNLEKGSEAFDENGLAKDGSMWVAFNYKPMPSTFWPTNGATDDVMLRLPKAFYQKDGELNKDIYFVNLGLIELAIQGMAVTTIPNINEQIMNIDINQDGELKHSENTLKLRSHYVGDAKNETVENMLYPKGIEFLHTVRYVGLDEDDRIVPSERFKEFRYMKKESFMPLSRLRQSYYREAKEKHYENLPKVGDYGDRGMANGFGWMIWGFIENEQGELRKQAHEEQFFCTGCHKTIGTTIDQTFAFPRKLAGAKGWGYIDLTKIIDAPNLGESQGEYLTYMQRVNGGDEFRQNKEMIDRWFDDGEINQKKIESLASIYDLIIPSRKRALDLNKAYYIIVKEQSFIFGRDPVLKPNTNVFKNIDTEIPPLEEAHRHQWDIRLSWQSE